MKNMCNTRNPFTNLCARAGLAIKCVRQDWNSDEICVQTLESMYTSIYLSIYLSINHVPVFIHSFSMLIPTRRSINLSRIYLSVFLHSFSMFESLYTFACNNWNPCIHLCAKIRFPMYWYAITTISTYNYVEDMKSLLYNIRVQY